MIAIIDLSARNQRARHMGSKIRRERSRDAASQPVPIVLLSGLPFIPNAPGVSDFLSKPINPSRLLDCVRRFCGEPE